MADSLLDFHFFKDSIRPRPTYISYPHPRQLSKGPLNPLKTCRFTVLSPYSSIRLSTPSSTSMEEVAQIGLSNMPRFNRMIREVALRSAVLVS